MDNYGQLFITGISGLALTEEESAFISTEKIGGVILCEQNFKNPSQLAELINQIQKLRDDYPLYIAVSHESGAATQFKSHFTQFPSMAQLAKLDSPKIVFEVHQVMAKELVACGVNLSLSPCCDVLTNPNNKAIAERSYGNNPETVEKFISAAIRGLQTSGLLSTAKHFPGAGGAQQIVKTSVEDLKKTELIPFVKASKSRVEFMMMSHLVVDSLGDNLPCSLNPKAYELLRSETKFTKIVVTDDIDQLFEQISPGEAALKALSAGADMLMFRDQKLASAALSSVKEAVKKRLIKKDVLTDKLLRIEKSKKENLPSYQPIYIPKITEVFNSMEAKNLTAQIIKAIG
jgi:beta-N-acetylhexosaminidase